MDAQTFLDNFGTIAQTPGGLERLRQLIIHLAVWGRFTGLEAGDSGQPEESHGHLTLLPSGWQELELGAFCEIYQPRTITKNDMVPGGKHPVYGANGQIGHFDEYNHAESEVTIGCRGTCGAVNVIPAFSWITGNAMVVKPDPEVLSKAALALVLRDIDYSEVISGTAQPQITRTNLAPTVVPIPPREEQHRIVAKVDELMALCDQLGTQQQTRTQTATKFRASALDALTTAETADELQTAWQRIHTNWGALSTDVESVDGLRQLILNLAVRGRLV